MEPKKNVPLHTRNLVCSGTKEIKFFNSIFEKCFQVQRLIWNQKQCPTADQKYGVQWDKRIGNISTQFLKNAPSPQIDMEEKKMSHCIPGIWRALGHKGSQIFQLFF